MRVRSWFRDPVFLLGLVAGLIAFAVQSGELGSADTQHRLNSTHAFWTSEPPVYDWEYPEFGVHGRGGRLQSWYGIGQSLLMLPQDMIGTFLDNLPLFAHYKDTDPTVRNIFVSYSTNIVVTVLTALVCFRFLRQFAFTINHSIAGSLALLIATTHLHYTQNMMENNYIFLLTVTGFCFEYEWLQTGSRRSLLIGAGAFGLNLLTRLTTGLDLLAGVAFVLLILWFEHASEFWPRLKTYAATAIPVFCVFGLLDRLYQFYRFGSFYQHLRQRRRQRNARAPPRLAKNLPVRDPLSLRFLRRTLRTRKIHLPLRPAAHPRHPRHHPRLEAIQSRDSRLHHRLRPHAARLHLLLRSLHRMERRRRLGRSLRLHFR